MHFIGVGILKINREHESIITNVSTIAVSSQEATIINQGPCFFVCGGGQPLKTERQSFRAVPCDGCAPGKAGPLPTQGEGAPGVHIGEYKQPKTSTKGPGSGKGSDMFIELQYCTSIWVLLCNIRFGKKEGAAFIPEPLP